MNKILAIEHLTLDGVYQAPARPDEDIRNGFEYGGWGAAAARDPVMQKIMGKYMGASWSLLSGRITYEDLYGFWPRQPPNLMTNALNKVEKFVVSATLAGPLPWQNSVLLKGNPAEAIRKLKKQHDKKLVIFGSGMLLHSLMQDHLIDEYILMIHPVVLGKGYRLFPDGSPFANLSLVESVTTGTSVIIGIYRTVEEKIKM